jgi:ABC-2 type transport system permease protein
MFGHAAMNPGILLLCLNALIFTIVCLSIGFLAGKYIKSGVAQSAFTNVVSLGVSFISGVFVEQELLGDTVLKIASFTPGYWYVRAVSAIRNLSAYSLGNITPVFYDMLIQLGFAAAFVIIALVSAKQKRVGEA